MKMQMVTMMQQSNIERAVEDADDDKATIKLREVIIPMTTAATPTTQYSNRDSEMMPAMTETLLTNKNNATIKWRGMKYLRRQR